MAEENAENVEEAGELSHAEKTRPVLDRQDFVVLHSGVRKRHTRGKRMRNPMAYRARFVQRIGGDIVVRRNRPARVNEKAFVKHREEILQRVQAGLLEVRTPDGRLIDAANMQVVEPPREPAPTKPEPVKAEDMPVGRPIPITPEGTAQTEPIDPPKITQPIIPEGQEPAVDSSADTQPTTTTEPPETEGSTLEEKVEAEQPETVAVTEASTESSTQPEQTVDAAPPDKSKTSSSKKSSSKKGSGKKNR